MKKGQNCLVKWQVANNSDQYMWHEAVIKSVESETITVIWKEGQWKGHETDRLPFDWILVNDDITSVREDVAEVKKHLSYLRDDKKDFIKLFFSKLDGINLRLDKMNDHLQRNFTMGTFCDDEVNYDMARLKESLNSLNSIHMYSGDEEQNEKYVSNQKKSIFHRYNNTD